MTVTTQQARRQSIVACRESKMTYQAIGAEHGISCEWVRQILHKEGRSDLCGSLKPPIEKTCPACGIVFGNSKRFGKKRAKNAGSMIYCSIVCQVSYRSRTPTAIEREKAEIVFLARAANKTWREAGEAIGDNGKNPSRSAQHYAKIWGRKTGADVSWAFPGTTSRPPNLTVPPGFFEGFAP